MYQEFPNINQNPFERKRLNELFDRAIMHTRITYLSGYTGWGKTTAVVLWLKRRQKQLDTKDNFYWLTLGKEEHPVQILSELEKTWKRNQVVVLDDFQKLKPVEREKISQYILLSKFTYFILSRGKMPECFYSELGRKVQIMGSDDLRLTKEEIVPFLKYYDIGEEYRADIIRKVENKNGWILGFHHLVQAMKSIGGGYNEAVGYQTMESIYTYFDNDIQKEWTQDERKFLLTIGGFEQLNLRQIKLLTKRNDVEQMMNTILNRDSFFTMVKKDTYEINYFYRSYIIRTRPKYMSLKEIGWMYKRAGRIFEQEGEYQLSLEAYLQGKDRDSIALLLDELGKTADGKAELWNYRYYYRAIKEKQIKESPSLCCSMAILETITHRLEHAKKWKEYLQEILQKEPAGTPWHKEIELQLRCLSVYMPQEHHKNILLFLRDVARKVQTEKILLPNSVITANRPSVLNGGGDFSIYLRHAKLLFDPMDKIVSILWGNQGVGVMDVAVAESYYQQNNITQSLLRIVGAIPKIEQEGETNMLFAAMFLQMKIMMAGGQIHTAIPMATYMQQRIEKKKKIYLLPNLKAVVTWGAMYVGDYKVIENWMQSEAPNENAEFCTLDRFQYFVKLRVYLMQRDHLLFLALAKRIETILVDFHRTMEQCELHILTAMSYYIEGHLKESFDHSEQAIQLGKTYDYQRLFGDEGGIMYLLLRDYRDTHETSPFIKKILEQSKNTGLYYPEYLKGKPQGHVALSETEMEVMRLMAADRTNAQISEFMGITVNTVKFHCKNIFQKLGVRSRAQAVKAAKIEDIL